MRRSQFLSFGLWMPIGLFILGGCATAPVVEEPPATAAPLTIPDFEDVPVPAGFTKNSNESVVVETPTFRIGLLVYEGKAETGALAEFFKANLRVKGWQMLSSFLGKEAQMVFVKGDRSCLITVSQKAASTRLEVRVGTSLPATSPPPQTPGSPSPSPPTQQ
ncbi:MAG: hypothetical protein HY347_10315 [candidate division NC10 bacterium]|nr:hypothetical protein [candidate division NC10 bacterium]